MLSTAADILLGLKDFVVGSVLGLANGPYSWFSWVFPLAAVAGAAAGIATGNAAVALGLAAGVPLAAAALGGVIGLITGGVSETMNGFSERRHNRAEADKAEAVDKPRAKEVTPAPAKAPSPEKPTTEITTPSVPQRAVTPEQVAGRG